MSVSIRFWGDCVELVGTLFLGLSVGAGEGGMVWVVEGWYVLELGWLSME